VRKFVGVDRVRAKFGEHAADKRLPGSDTASEADFDHDPKFLSTDHTRLIFRSQYAEVR
jgi:hypothetical protein